MSGVAARLLLPRRAEVAVEEAGELGALEVDVDEAGTGGARSPRSCTPRRASRSGVCGGATGSTDPWSAELAGTADPASKEPESDSGRSNDGGLEERDAEPSDIARVSSS